MKKIIVLLTLLFAVTFSVNAQEKKMSAEEAAKKPRVPQVPRRDEAADNALFESEMMRLAEDSPSEAGRSKR